MNVSTPNKLACTEAGIQNAISALEKKELKSTRKAAGAFNIPYTSIQRFVSIFVSLSWVCSKLEVALGRSPEC